ncbi:MAG: SRPBCC family protein [Sinimarinibacterium flocculans]|uniref:SRPBCC family protein n=1 Tax=Sinimarinibacterium flocculans TaxID=985250 RepID=UPI003C453886
MRVLKWLVIVVAILIVSTIGIGFVLPDRASLERSVVVDAPPATVYTALNGFRQFNHWSPWAALDPDAVYLHEGPPVGVGAKMSWRSDDPSVGSGSQEIVETVPFERVRMRLEFEGFDSENYASLSLEPEGEGTRVTWDYDTRFHGDLLGRYFGLMLDGMLGPFYERGLAALQSFVETLPVEDISNLEVDVIEVEPRPIVYLSAAAGPDDAGQVLAAAHARLAAHLAANGMQRSAPPIAITREYNEETGAWRFDAAMIVNRADPPADEAQGIRSGRSYGGWVARAAHTGPYETSAATYRQLLAWRSAAGLEDNGDSWEQYPGDPAATEQPSMYVFWPIR